MAGKQYVVLKVNKDNKEHMEILEQTLNKYMEEECDYYTFDAYGPASAGYNTTVEPKELKERLDWITSFYKDKYTEEYINKYGYHMLVGNTIKEMANNTVDYIKSGMCTGISIFCSNHIIIVGILQEESTLTGGSISLVKHLYQEKNVIYI